MNRVVVTGMGVINALGKDVDSYWDALVNGRSGIVPIKERWKRIYNYYDDQVTPWIGAEIKNYDASEYFSKRALLTLDPVSQFTLIAADQAVRDAGLEFEGQSCETTAIILGTATGGDESRDEASFRFFSEKSRLSNLTIIRTMANAPVGHVSIKYGITGPCYTVQSACASSGQAIGQAYQWIKHGLAKRVITGGSENLPSLGLFKSWEAMRILDPVNCRPFCANRKGLVLGEGAGIFVLETLEDAKRRGAKIYGEIIGCSMTSDAKNIVSPSQEGAARAMRQALKDARLEPAEIDYINAHGTGTAMNDKTEIEAIKTVFGEHALKLSISSTKSMHGHALGATSIFEAIATVLALQDNVVPPTQNHEQIDPNCDLDITPNLAKEKKLNRAISNSFGFGGSNSVLVFQNFS